MIRESVMMAQTLADEHWTYVGALEERTYKEAFLHGYKHGLQDARDSKQWETTPNPIPKVKSMGKVVAQRKYPVDVWQSFGE